MIQDNIDNLPVIEESTDREICLRKMNTFIKKMIEQYKQSIIDTTSEVNMEWIERIRKKYFYEDHNDLLPIPAFSNTAPKNTIHFF